MWFKHTGINDRAQPKLCMKSTASIPNAPSTIKGALKRFEIMMKIPFNQRSTMLGSSIIKLKDNVLINLQDYKECIMLLTDKNLGPCVMNRYEWMRQFISKHLSNSENCKRMTKEVAEEHNNKSMKEWVAKELRSFTKMMITWIRDSSDLTIKLQNLGEINDNDYLFSTDTESMCPNIDT